MRAPWMLLVLSLAAAGCGDANGGNCKDACDKLLACELPPSQFPCDPRCTEPGDICVGCILDETCANLADRRCAASCPQPPLTPP